MPDTARLQRLLQEFKSRTELSDFLPLIVGGYKHTPPLMNAAEQLQSPLNHVERFRADASFGSLITTEAFITDITTALRNPALLGDLATLWEPVLGRLTRACTGRDISHLSFHWADCYKRVQPSDLLWWIEAITKIKEALSTYLRELREEALSQSSTSLTLAGSSRASMNPFANFDPTLAPTPRTHLSVTGLDPQQHELLADMMRQHENNSAFKSYRTRVRSDTVLNNYFSKIQLELDNLIAAVKAIASGQVEGTNLTKHLIRLTRDFSNAVLSLVGFPGAGALVGLLAFGAETANERAIQIFATRLSRLFPNTGENGEIIEALALLLTVHQSYLIHNPPPLTDLTPATRQYLSAAAKFRGQDTFTEIDALVANQVKTITTFWYELPEAPIPTIEQWLPELLAKFRIALPAAIDAAQIGATLSASSSAEHVQRAIHEATPAPTPRLRPAPPHTITDHFTL